MVCLNERHSISPTRPPLPNLRDHLPPALNRDLVGDRQGETMPPDQNANVYYYDNVGYPPEHFNGHSGNCIDKEKDLLGKLIIINEQRKHPDKDLVLQRFNSKPTMQVDALALAGGWKGNVPFGKSIVEAIETPAPPSGHRHARAGDLSGAALDAGDANTPLYQPSHNHNISRRCVGDVAVDTTAPAWAAAGDELVMQLPSVLVIGVRQGSATPT